MKYFKSPITHQKNKIIIECIWELPDVDQPRELVPRLIVDAKTILPRKEIRCFTVRDTMCVKAVSLIPRKEEA